MPLECCQAFSWSVSCVGTCSGVTHILFILWRGSFSPSTTTLLVVYRLWQARACDTRVSSACSSDTEKSLSGRQVFHPKQIPVLGQEDVIQLGRRWRRAALCLAKSTAKRLLQLATCKLLSILQKGSCNLHVSFTTRVLTNTRAESGYRGSLLQVARAALATGIALASRKALEEPSCFG